MTTEMKSIIEIAIKTSKEKASHDDVRKFLQAILIAKDLFKVYGLDASVIERGLSAFIAIVIEALARTTSEHNLSK